MSGARARQDFSRINPYVFVPGEARRHLEFANETTVQVVAGALAATNVDHPASAQRTREPEQMDHEECLAIAGLYLGKLTGQFTGWTPLQGRGELFPERLDVDSPWQLHTDMPLPEHRRDAAWPIVLHCSIS